MPGRQRPQLGRSRGVAKCRLLRYRQVWRAGVLQLPPPRSSAMECLRSLAQLQPRAVRLPRRTLCSLALGLTPGTRPVAACGRAAQLLGRRWAAPLYEPRRLPTAGTTLSAPQPRDAGLAVIPGSRPDRRSPRGCGCRPRSPGPPLGARLLSLAQVRVPNCVLPAPNATCLLSFPPPRLQISRPKCACEKTLKSFALTCHHSAEAKIRLIYLKYFFKYFPCLLSLPYGRTHLYLFQLLS